MASRNPENSSEGPPSNEDVLYDSPRTSLGRRLVVAVFTGLAFHLLVRFAAWGFQPRATSWLGPGLGAFIAVSLAVAALASRVVRRVVILSGELLLYRDPGGVEVIPLDRVASCASEPSTGGWSRDPSELLVISLRDGSSLRRRLPDDADTPGIVRDLNGALADASSRA